MKDKTLLYIDYLKVLDVIRNYSSSDFVRQRIADLRPLQNKKEIEDRLDRIEAVLALIQLNGRIPLGEAPDIRDLTRRMDIAESLEIEEFTALLQFLRTCRDVAGYLRKAIDRSPYVEDLLERIKPPAEVMARISRTINPEGFIEDSASYELSKIRSDLYQLRERVKKYLEKVMEHEEVRSVLQDTFVSVRNGRYVIPLKPNFNQFFQGIVHDYSHSLKTSFVEPMETVEQNNQISMLEKEEKEEERRVLEELTVWTHDHATEIRGNFEALSDLDFYYAIALFSGDFGCLRPSVGTEATIDIRGARNPFLILSRRDRAIPIDILLAPDKKAMIISGPNAGGKTVALKTIGLLVAMAASGLFVPARERPKVPLYSGLFAVLGDEQDMAMELSTFTAHVQAIKGVYETSRGGELVLIDEIGGGTEPQEASALSMGIIDAFVEKRCTIIVTTHLNLLKAYAYTQPFALNVATDFEGETMQPLYRLVYGRAGVSNAIKVAEKSEMPAPIIEKSYAYLGKQEHVLNDLVRGLEIEKAGAEEERRKAIAFRDDMKKRVSFLKEKREEYLKKAEEKARVLILEVEMEMVEIGREIRKRDRTAFKNAGDRLNLVKRRLSSDNPDLTEEVHVGDYVRVGTVGKEGYIARIDEEKNRAEVVMDNLRMSVDRGYVRKVQPQEKEQAVSVKVNVPESDSLEINVRGMRVEEALEEVDRFVDRAVVHGAAQVKVIHGIGTGRLMTAIRRHLSETKPPKNIRRDERNSGVTIVELL